MTDVIVESRDGRRIHSLIPDGHPAIVYIKEGGTFRVKMADLTPEMEMIRRLEYSSR
jgi:hypothetical protein